MRSIAKVVGFMPVLAAMLTCLPSAAAATDAGDSPVADAARDFGGVQGKAGWQYGYERTAPGKAGRDANATFHRFEQYQAGQWRGPGRAVPAISADGMVAAPGLTPVRRWMRRQAGSVRLIGRIRKPDAAAQAELRVVADGRTIWRCQLGPGDAIAHAFDIVAPDLTPSSTVDLLAVARAGSKRVALDLACRIVAEPYVSRWRADLPTGYPKLTEAQRQTQRQAGQRVLRQIREASKAGRRRMVIPPGDYLFKADWSRQSTLKNLADLEIVARGVTFWFEPPMIHALKFVNCRNVTLNGLTIDFTIPCWFQAHVTNVDRRTKTIRASLMSGYEPRDAEGKIETAGDRAMIFYDPAGRFINQSHSPGKWRLTDDGKGVVCYDLRRAGIPAALKCGDYVVGTIRTGGALRSINCAHMRFEDVNVFSSPGMAVFEVDGAGANAYLRIRATRRPHTNRLQAFGADVFHMAATDHGPLLERCEAAYGADDVLNIHGQFGRVVKQVDGRHYYLQGTYAAGDHIEFRDSSSVALLGKAKVAAAKASPNGPSLAINDRFTARGEYLVTLDAPLKLSPLSLVVMDSKRSSAGFVVRDCWFHSDFQRTLINGAPGGLIENNTLQNLGNRLCVQFETWGPWMEGPFARNLTIRNNRFLGAPPAGPAISVGMFPPGGGTDRRRFKAMPVTHMTITGNYFSHTDGPAVSVANVNSLMIEDNSIDRASTRPGRRDWLQLQDCANVSVKDNAIPAARH